MKTFLLTWNKKRWQWEDLNKAIDATKKRNKYSEVWSCRTKQIKKGDRVFLIKLGDKPRGIFASGYAGSELFEVEHWDEEKRNNGELVNSVCVEFDTVLDPDNDIILNQEDLNKGILSLQHWSPQNSGISIKDEVLEELEKRWDLITKRDTYMGYNSYGYEYEPEKEERLVEGARKNIVVNAYERNYEARKKCIEHYGAVCQICNFDSTIVYGEEFIDKIHVHHIKPLNEIKGEYIVDPIKDLIPVCPNCHMILHSQSPAYTPDEIRNKLISI